MSRAMRPADRLQPVGPGLLRPAETFRTGGTGRSRDVARARIVRALRAALARLPILVALALIAAVGLVAERQAKLLARLELRESVRIAAEAAHARIDAALAAEMRLLGVIEGALADGSLPDDARLGALLERFRPAGSMVGPVAARLPDGTVVTAPSTDRGAAALAALLRRPPEAGGVKALGLPEPALLVRSDGPELDFAAAISLRALYALAAGAHDDPPIDVAIATGGHEGREILLGRGDVFADAPVLLPLAEPTSGLRLAAAPRGGWDAAASEATVWGIRVATALAAFLVAASMLRTRSLVEERQRAIATLRERETELARLSRRLGLALDASRVGVWDYDIDADMLVWDDRMDELYGLPRDGRARVYADWRGALYPDDRTRAEEEFRVAIHETGRYDSEYRLILPGGAIRHIRAIGAVYGDPDGAKRIVGVNWDVTADVQRNAELEAKRVEAEAASVAKSQFLATMSHEIRTPLNGVLGMIELLRGGRLDPEQRRRAEVAGDSARHLLAILNDILDLSRLEADRMTLDRRPIDVAALLREAAALNSAAAGERGLALEVGIDPGLPPLLRCDPTRLRQVVLNLVGNAVKFTDAGSVRISARHLPGRGGQLEVEVRDTGIGIPEADQRRLFQRFVQVDGSSTRRRGGAGLGLAISRQIVELMGGRIDCRSAPGEGSAFRFRIPAPACAPEKAPEQAPRATLESTPGPIPAGAAETAPTPDAPTPRTGLRVLLAEDNATNRHIFSAFLAAAGHEVVIAENGARAVDAAAAGGFDVVLMDIQMPELDGMAAAGRIRALPGAPGAVPIVALTANAMPGDRERYIAAGMDDYVAKPVTAAALDAALSRMTLLCRA